MRITRIVRMTRQNAHYLHGERRVYNLGMKRADARLFPLSMLCPITRKVFVDPVVGTDGYSYERAAMERWLMTNNVSPTTGAIIGSKLVSNHSLRIAIDTLDEKFTTQ